MMKSFLKVTKWVFGLTAIFIIIFLAYNIKTVPNYATKRGYEIVWRDDYEKYNQGYCLVEDRILDKEEVLEKSLNQYFQKTIILNKKIRDFRIYNYGSYWNCSAIYYSLENIRFDNFYEEFFKKYNPAKKVDGLHILFFDEFGAKEINPMNIIQIKDKEAYLLKPIIYTGHSHSFSIFLKKFILKKSKEYVLTYEYDFLPEGYGKLNIEQSLGDYRQKNDYKSTKVDNCGNLDFDVKKKFEKSKEATAG